ncbi:hypothetical protein ASPCADRAFT_209657 [Aspergillus carbonarius ITEM 5010]|uniref:Uncharacterized protein n=1 Tax=Aspergillus carbonarius (strain ITEM 5010) TaxID=602072 RepID=A0A1R3REV3_ASPC5|nr:hypothetical protein ASPCADRAFT_209657 [Aspergillus carbonarius ITEM 5010]
MREILGSSLRRTHDAIRLPRSPDVHAVKDTTTNPTEPPFTLITTKYQGVLAQMRQSLST